MYNSYQFMTILLILSSSKSLKITINEYCTSPSNTPCYYGCKTSKDCTTKYKFKSLTDEERIIILSKHNSVRNSVATGSTHIEGLPNATNMNVLSYDKEVEYIAGCYVRQCIFRHDMMRRTLDGVDLGQNLFTISSKNKFEGDDKQFLEMAVDEWFQEIKIVPKNEIQSLINKYRLFRIKGEHARYFTQLVWASCMYIGCAKMYNGRAKGYFSYDLFCDYKPAGNIKGAEVYSTNNKYKCRKSNDLYKGLCGSIRPLSADTYQPPSGSTFYTSTLLWWEVIFFIFWLHF